MFVADFETTNDVDNCRVWQYALCHIYSESVLYGSSITEFFDLMAEKAVYDSPIEVYFHNLKFDLEFILHHALSNGWTHVDSNRNMKEKTFSTIITGNRLFYSATFCFKTSGKHTKKIIFKDSAKILPMRVADVAKAFDLDVSKLQIDHSQHRDTDHQITIEEQEYIKADVLIVARALKIVFSMGLDRMTISANAMHDYKMMIGKKKFDYLYPKLDDIDHELRQSYKGGFVYVKPDVMGKSIKDGIVFDVNSLYPHVMKSKRLPYGEPCFYEGKYEPDRIYTLYIQMIRCQFTVKPDHLPTIQIKNNIKYPNLEYLTSSVDSYGLDHEVTLVLTSVDLELFLEQYDVYNLEYICGYKFMSVVGLFDEYVSKWHEIKLDATEHYNKPMRALAKLMLNSLYGKFGTNPDRDHAKPYLDTVTNTVRYKREQDKTRPTVYIPMAAFITSYARDITIRAGQAHYDRFLYSDTDSLHLSGLDVPDTLDTDATRLGAWKHEFSFAEAKYLRPKSYMQYGITADGEMKTKVVVAGMPVTVHEYVNFKNFNYGTTFTIRQDGKKWKENHVYVAPENAKLKPIRCPGGIVLRPADFTLIQY